MIPTRLGLLAACAVALAPATLAQPAPARPNIVLIFPDNLGWGEVGAYGSVRGNISAQSRRSKGAFRARRP